MGRNKEINKLEIARFDWIEYLCYATGIIACAFLVVYLLMLGIKINVQKETNCEDIQCTESLDLRIRPFVVKDNQGEIWE